MNRREIILQEINDNPGIPLNYYLLAVEERAIGNTKICIDLLESLIDRFPNYHPSYYTLAELLYQLDRTDDGTHYAKLGIIVASELQLPKVVKELESLIIIND
jgi:tetratricopeptide (TPR) repeat protein